MVITLAAFCRAVFCRAVFCGAVLCGAVLCGAVSCSPLGYLQWILRATRCRVPNNSG